MGRWTRIDVDREEFDEARSTMGEININECDYATTPVLFDQLQTGRVSAEFRVRDGDVELHIFHPDRNLDQPWHTQFAYDLYEQILMEFRLEHFPDRVLVEYVPEVNGWYVVIRRVAVMKDPDQSRLEAMINAVP